MRIYLINMPFFEQEYTKFSEKWEYIENEYIGVSIVQKILEDEGCELIINQENSIASMIQKIQECHADTVMISLMQTSARLTYMLVCQLRHQGWNGVIFLGGWFIKMAWREIFKNNWDVDYVCYCDAEDVLRDWVRNPSGAKIGIADKENYDFHDKITIEQIREISRFPDDYVFPCRVSGRRTYCIETSRGCPHSNCTFCSQSCGNVMKNKWKPVPLELIRKQILEIHNQYGIVRFSTSDDDMLGPQIIAEERAKEIRSMLHSLPFKITFSTSISVRSATNGIVLDYLVDAGLEQLCVGFESADEIQLKRYGKQHSLEENYIAAEKITQRNIPLLPGLITFDPFATPETVSKNLNFLFNNLGHYDLGKLTKKLHILTGTPIQKMVEKAGLLTGDYLYYDYRFQNKEAELLYKQFCEYTDMVKDIQRVADKSNLKIRFRIGQYHRKIAERILAGQNWRYTVNNEIEKMKKILEENS